MLKRLSAIHIPFFCETKYSAQVCTKINKEWNIIIDFLHVVFAEWPWHLNIHEPLKIKEAHLVRLACCYAQQHLPSVRSKKLSHSKVECSANSKTPLVSHKFRADCKPINICYMSCCCCCSKNVSFSLDFESCIPSQHCFIAENKGKGRKALGFLIKSTKREPGTFLCVFVQMDEGVEEGVGETGEAPRQIWAPLLLKSGISSFSFYPVMIIN